MLWKPDIMVAAVTDVTPTLLRQRGINAVMVDMDETLLASAEQDIRSAFKSWVKSLLGAGLKVLLFSNGTRSRVSRSAKSLEIEGLHLAGKPFSFAFQRGLGLLGSQPSETAMIGDQLFTDVVGANLAGLTSILVSPLTAGGLPHTRALRGLERLLLNLDKKGGTHGSSLDR